jgi:hypothetical protein
MASDPLVLPGYHPYGPPIVIPGTRYGNPYGRYSAIWGYQDIQPGTYVPYVPYRFTARDYAAIHEAMKAVPLYRR